MCRFGRLGLLFLLVFLVFTKSILLAQRQPRVVPSTVTILALSSNTAVSGTTVTLTATVNAGELSVSPGLVTFCDALARYCEEPAVLGTAQLTILA